MTRRKVERPEGVFTVVLPDLDEGQSVAIWNGPRSPEETGLAARETIRFPLREDKGEGGDQ
jgi:hypothetical protein